MTSISNNDESRPAGEAAHVSSVDAIARFGGGVREFEDEARGALIAFDQQIQRALEWFDHELPAECQRQIRLEYEQVARTRSALENCEMRVVAGERPACLEEEQAHRRAKQSLERALARPERVRKWSIRMHREFDEFRGKSAGLRRRVEGDIPRMLGLLERTLTILDQYTEQVVREDGGESRPPSVGEAERREDEE